MTTLTEQFTLNAHEFNDKDIIGFIFHDAFRRLSERIPDGVTPLKPTEIKEQSRLYFRNTITSLGISGVCDCFIINDDYWGNKGAINFQISIAIP